MDAEAPFNAGDADIIILSSDGVPFRAHKSYLSLASSVFKDMFSLPSTSEATSHTIEPVQLTEKSTTIRNLLLLCYPASQTGAIPTAKSLSEVADLLEVTRKFDMPLAQKAVLPLLMKPKFMEQEALGVFAIECSQGRRVEAKIAAKATLKYELLSEKFSPEMAMLDIPHLYKVLQYRKQCTDVAVDAAEKLTWLMREDYPFLKCDSEELFKKGNKSIMVGVRQSPKKAKAGKSVCDTFSERVNVHDWLLEYLESTIRALRISPLGTAAKNNRVLSETLTAVSEVNCSGCSDTTMQDTFRFTNALAEEIQKRVDKVRYTTFRHMSHELTIKPTGSARIRVLKCLKDAED